MSLRAVSACGGEHSRRCPECKDDSRSINRSAVLIDEWSGAAEEVLGAAKVASSEEARTGLLTAAVGLLWAIGRLARDIQSETLSSNTESRAS
jgi:hypothetical protein